MLSRLVSLLENEYQIADIRTGLLDITFYRDDFRRRPGHLQPNKTRIDHLVEDQKVVFIDDVLYPEEAFALLWMQSSVIDLQRWNCSP